MKSSIISLVNLIGLFSVAYSYSLIQDLRSDSDSRNCELNGLVLRPGERQIHPTECLQIVCFRDGSGRGKVNHCPWNDDPDKEYADESLPYPKCCRLKGVSRAKSFNSIPRTYEKVAYRGDKQLQDSESDQSVQPSTYRRHPQELENIPDRRTPIQRLTTTPARPSASDDDDNTNENEERIPVHPASSTIRPSKFKRPTPFGSSEDEQSVRPSISRRPSQELENIPDRRAPIQRLTTTPARPSASDDDDNTNENEERIPVHPASSTIRPSKFKRPTPFGSSKTTTEKENYPENFPFSTSTNAPIPETTIARFKYNPRRTTTEESVSNTEQILSSTEKVSTTLSSDGNESESDESTTTEKSNERIIPTRFRRPISRPTTTLNSDNADEEESVSSTIIDAKSTVPAESSTQSIRDDKKLDQNENATTEDGSSDANDTSSKKTEIDDSTTTTQKSQNESASESKDSSSSNEESGSSAESSDSKINSIVEEDDASSNETETSESSITTQKSKDESSSESNDSSSSKPINEESDSSSELNDSSTTAKSELDSESSSRNLKDVKTPSEVNDSDESRSTTTPNNLSSEDSSESSGLQDNQTTENLIRVSVVMIPDDLETTESPSKTNNSSDSDSEVFTIKTLTPSDEVKDAEAVSTEKNDSDLKVNASGAESENQNSSDATNDENVSSSTEQPKNENEDGDENESSSSKPDKNQARRLDSNDESTENDIKPIYHRGQRTQALSRRNRNNDDGENGSISAESDHEISKEIPDGSR